MTVSMSAVMIYTLIHLALVSIWVLPILVLAVCAVFLARSRGDAARRFFTLSTKLTFGFFTLSLILHTAYDADLFLINGYSIGYFSYSAEQSDLFQSLRLVVSHLYTVGRLFENLASIVLLLALTELGSGILTSIGQVGSRLKKLVRFATLAVGFLGLVISLAECGKRNATYNNYYGRVVGAGTLFDFYTGMNVSNQLQAAFDITFFVACLVVVAYSGYAVHKANLARVQTWSASILMAAAVLNTVRFLWKLIFDAAFLIRMYAGVSRGTIASSIVAAPNYTRIIDAILNIWLFAVVMILLFVVGTKKVGGLWSNPQAIPGAQGPLPTQQYWQPVYVGQPKPGTQGFVPQYAPQFAPQNGMQPVQYVMPQNGHPQPHQVPANVPTAGHYQPQPAQAQS